jgi:hypothetical protein
MDSRSGGRIHGGGVGGEYDLERIVIDYQKLCHDIYPLDWKH